MYHDIEAPEEPEFTDVKELVREKPLPPDGLQDGELAKAWALLKKLQADGAAPGTWLPVVPSDEEKAAIVSLHAIGRLRLAAAKCKRTGALVGLVMV
jgi:hypothetical protein